MDGVGGKVPVEIRFALVLAGAFLAVLPLGRIMDVYSWTLEAFLCAPLLLASGAILVGVGLLGHVALTPFSEAVLPPAGEALPAPPRAPDPP